MFNRDFLQACRFQQPLSQLHIVSVRLAGGRENFLGNGHREFQDLPGGCPGLEQVRFESQQGAGIHPQVHCAPGQRSGHAGRWNPDDHVPVEGRGQVPGLPGSQLPTKLVGPAADPPRLRQSLDKAV